MAGGFLTTGKIIRHQAHFRTQSLATWALKGLTSLVGGRASNVQAGGHYRLQKGHHGSEARPELLDGMLLLCFPLGKEVGAAVVVFLYPLFREAAFLTFRQELLDRFASFVGDDARASGVVALFGGVADGVAHVAKASAVNEVAYEIDVEAS